MENNDLKTNLDERSNVSELTSSVVIYTDGACKGNPGPGGWGVYLNSGGVEKDLFGGELQTTNNRMELTAVIEALTALKKPCKVALYLDSEYVRQGITLRVGRLQQNNLLKMWIFGKNLMI